MNPESEKLDALAQRIRQAEAKPKRKAEPGLARNAGYDFAGTVVGSVIIGVLLDRFFGTTPWCLVGMVVMGFVSGIMGVWSRMQKAPDKQDEDTE
ncbi:MAG: AtpZ/AtpI family protein [Alphaproteobacteria bacterium]|nr:AtpZ/AtpI family protein [Alphaproteobacteria bacterium]